MEPVTGAADPGPGSLEVAVERTGGIGGMVRRWTATVPDDGRPAARAAHRIAGFGPAPAAGGPRGSGEGPASGSGSPATGRLRDGFQWEVRCGAGSLRCDEPGRRGDPELDALIREVTGQPGRAGAGHGSGHGGVRPDPRHCSPGVYPRFPGRGTVGS